MNVRNGPGPVLNTIGNSVERSAAPYPVEAGEGGDPGFAIERSSGRALSLATVACFRTSGPTRVTSTSPAVPIGCPANRGLAAAPQDVPVDPELRVGGHLDGHLIDGQVVGQIDWKAAMAQVGYVRVSTADQDVALQRDALTKAGIEKIFDDQGVSGSKTDRPGLTAALDYLREGDTLVVWKLDRLGRSMSHLLKTVSDLEERGVGFRSLTEQIDTTTSAGRLVFGIFGALGQFERDLIRERTTAGLAAAAARGRKGGRPMAATPAKVAEARKHIARGLTVREAAARVKVGKTALYAALRASAE